MIKLMDYVKTAQTAEMLCVSQNTLRKGVACRYSRRSTSAKTSFKMRLIFHPAFVLRTVS